MSDLINRQDARNLLAARLYQTADDIAYVYENIVKNRLDVWLNEIPSAERWIPCSKEMPEENYETGNGVQFSADVLITIINHANDGEKYTWVSKTVDGKWYEYSSTPHCVPNWCEVIAWMPLPEPYKEGKKKIDTLKERVASEDLFPGLSQEIKDKNAEIAKAYAEGYEHGKADAVRRGHWIKDRYCSVCGWSNEEVYYTDGWTGNCCPNCGARMENEE